MPASQPWLLEAVGTARWLGVPLRSVLEEAGLGERAVEILFTGLDRGVEGGLEQSYQRSLPVAEAMREEVLLVYEMNGAPLLPQHGFPLRLVVPGWYGMTNVKWLTAVTVLDHPFTGYQQEHSYRLRDDEDDDGIPLTRMLPRALMVPPGIPEFLTRERLLAPGEHVLQGRAWSGHAPIASVEVSVDGGESWEPAETSRDLDSPWAWCSWTYRWSATPGRLRRSAAGRRTRPGTCSRSIRPGTSAATRTTARSRSPSPFGLGRCEGVFSPSASWSSSSRPRGSTSARRAEATGALTDRR